MRQTTLIAVLTIALIGASTACRKTAGPADVAAARLRCESLSDPMGIDAAHPRLGWVLQPAGPGLVGRGHRQAAYRILVASTPSRLAADEGDLWDTGRVESNLSIGIEYAGQPMTSGLRAHWKVRVWDESGRISEWSEPAAWSMGLLEPGDWSGRWIGMNVGEPTPADEARRLPARYLRREISLAGDVEQATAYISGLGLSELSINGRKAGDHVLSPALSEYDKHVFYIAHDVTALLQKGANAVGVVLGNGRFHAPRVKDPTGMRNYGLPRLLLRLDVRFKDGTSTSLVSDGLWKATDRGPITADNEYDGEEYDARMELDGWDKPGFDDSKWAAADLMDAPGGRMTAPMIEPIRVVETLRPAAVTNPKPGVFIYDLGQNIVGWCRLHVQGPAGTQIRLRHAETLKADGTLYTDNLRSAKATDVYTLHGGGAEIYEPRFTYHGFRFVEMTGFPGTPEADALEGRVVHDDMERAGDFETSNPLLNKIAANILWGTRGNYRSIPTDCPQRDERQGWLGDRSSVSRGEAYLFDVAAFYAKWARDIADAQKGTGSVPDVAPAFWFCYNDGIVWPSTFVIVPRMLLDMYGDAGTIKALYPALKKWADYMAGFLKDGIMPRNTYGDWCVPPETPTLIHSKDPARVTRGDLISTAYYFYDLGLMARAAEIVGEKADAARWRQMAETLREAFNRTFFDPAKGVYDNGTQTSSVLALAFGLVPEDRRAGLFAHLVEKIEKESGGHVGTGLVGAQWLMRVLSDNGRPDLAYAMLTKSDYPGWGYMVSKGATTIWELWNGDTADPAMNSGNHVMQIGDLAIWMRQYLAGIRPDPESPGFGKIIIRPTPVGDLTWVRGSYESVHGTIRSSWKKEGGELILEVTIPPNTTATGYVPAASPDTVTEGGRPLNGAEGVKVLRTEAGCVVLAVESGAYRFAAKI
ncbi:MAG: glycoside hydrolase family 78 protein [Candidatus Aminicenantes bacterium]|nr:glycoside hydrolase family 78 protein [Candidatus Aminicenantes bacterium]